MGGEGLEHHLETPTKPPVSKPGDVNSDVKNAGLGYIRKSEASNGFSVVRASWPDLPAEAKDTVVAIVHRYRHRARTQAFVATLPDDR